MAESPYYFDNDAAQLAVDFFQEMLTHTTGEWAGQPFQLMEYQEKLLRDVFGWKRKVDGGRRYRVVWMEVPRKNGKSEFVSGASLYQLYCDREPRAQIFSAAADTDQAAIVFDTAKLMVFNNAELLSRSIVLRKSITVPETGGVFRVLSKTAKTKHGLNAHGIYVDEVHAQPNRELIDTLRTSTGARRQPLEFYTTTAGYDRNSICWEFHEYARKVARGILEDDSWYVCIHSAADDDDWDTVDWLDPMVWERANPALGHTVKQSYLEQAAREAQAKPAEENTFKRLHLNIWTEQASRWLKMDRWDACGVEPLHELEGRECWAGLDLSSKIDLSSLVLAFPTWVADELETEDGLQPVQIVESIDILPFFWCPNDRISARAREDGVPYDLWARQGLITPTDGEVIDYRAIQKAIFELRERFIFREIAFDPWNAQQLATELDGEGFVMVPHRQGFYSMSGPCKDFEALVISGKLRHAGNPVLRWMASNVAVRVDPSENIRPDKEKSNEKIDGIVAAIMAVGRAMLHENEAPKPSVYEERGLLEI